MAGIVSPSDPRIGAMVESLDTPTLLLDLDAADRNIRRMAEFLRGRPSQLRPHFKNHKCATLARRQLDAGAVGITCAKLSEAEVLVRQGFRDILIANQVVGDGKVHRLVEIAAVADIAVAVDHIDQVTALSKAAVDRQVTVGVLVEVDIGMGRCGLPPGEPVLQFVRRIQNLPGIRFFGLQAYEGHLVNVLDREERKLRSVAAMSLAVETRRLLESAGIPVACLSGCSSATYDCTGVLDGVDEIQAGTYVTMDRQYRKLAPEFENAMSLLVRVISTPAAGRAVVDVGVKGGGGEFGVPEIRDYPEVQVPFFMAEEHTVILNAPDWRIGTPLHMIPSHACTTCNLHREFVIHQGGRVVDIWPIEGSGKLV